MDNEPKEIDYTKYSAYKLRAYNKPFFYPPILIPSSTDLSKPVKIILTDISVSVSGIYFTHTLKNI